MLWACQVHHRLQGSVDELCRPYQGNGQQENSPIPAGYLKPKTDRDHKRGDDGVQPGISLRTDDMPPSLESMTKGMQAGIEEFRHFIHARSLVNIPVVPGLLTGWSTFSFSAEVCHGHIPGGEGRHERPAG